MTGSYCMPIGGNCTPVVYQDKNNHHVLGSALLGGTAAYGAYKLNLDIVKDSMSASAFEDAIRSGKKIEYSQPLTTAEKSLLSQVKKDIIPEAHPEISRTFATDDALTMYDYLRERHGGHIKTVQDLEKAIARKEKTVDTDGNTSYADMEKQDKRRPHIQELKQQSDKLTSIENEILEKNARQAELEKALEGKDFQRLTGDKKVLAEIQKNERELSSIRRRLGELHSNRSSIAGQIEKLMKTANITDKSIGELSGGIYTKLADLKDDLRVTMNDAKASGAIGKRKAFFDGCHDSALFNHNEMLKNRPKVDEKIAGMKADLELVRAAEAGDGFVTKSMAQEAYQKLGSEVGKGEESIAKAFEALGKKLPKEIPSLKRAGLLGAVVALGLYCFNN